MMASKSVDISYSNQMIGEEKCQYFSRSSDYVLPQDKCVDEKWDSFCTRCDGNTKYQYNPRPPCIGKDNCKFYTPVSKNRD